MIPIHILLAEDNKIDVHFVESLLNRSKHLNATVDSVAWLKSALQSLNSPRVYDLILLDLGLKDSQGIDTAIDVIRAAPNTPVVVLSAREDLDIAQMALRAGAQSFIVKASDLTVEHLERVILYALERKRVETQAKRLVLQSHAQLTSTDGPDAHMFEPHLNTIDKSVGQVEVYLSRNAPGHYDEVRGILDQSGFYTALREIRSLLDLEVSRRTKAAPSGVFKALKEASKSTPPETQQAARASIADALVDWDPEVWGDETP